MQNFEKNQTLNILQTYQNLQKFENLIRVDHCASNTNGKLEPAAAGTTNDSSLLTEFLRDLVQNDKIDLQIVQNDSMTNDSKKLFLFLNNLFGSKAS